MWSMKDIAACGSSRCTLSVYKGLKVEVYMVNKTEISLSDQDLVELVNVRIPVCLLLLSHFAQCSQTPTLSCTSSLLYIVSLLV